MMISKTESGLLSLAFALIIVALYQLWQPINYHTSSQLVLGELDSLENSAKLKVSGDLVWRDARRGDPVSEGASLFTGEAAQAVLSMNSGNMIHLSSNTLIRITERVELENGLVNTTLGENAMELDISGEKIKVQGSGAQLQLSSIDKQTTLSVVEGNVTVSGREKKIELKKNEGLELVVGSESKKILFELALLAPATNQVLWTRETKEVRFEWSEGSEVLFELASDIKFNTILVAQPASEGKYTISLKPGQYYWRVTQGKKKSRLSSLTILEERPIVLFQPSLSSDIEMQKESEHIQLLQWSDTRVAAYELTVEREGLTEKFVIPQTDYQLKFNTSGKIRWKVSPVDESRPLALGSDWQSFTLRSPESLLAPLWSEKEIEIAKARGDESEDVSFTSKGVEHEWQLLQNNQVLKAQRQATMSLSFPYQERAGEYQLIVRSFNKHGKASEWSEPLIVKWKPFQERLPIEGQEIQLDRPDQLVSFEWQGEGEHYFELSTDESFSQIIISRKALTQTEIVFPEVGTYYWRVRNLDGSYSAPKKVKVEPSPPLDAPEAPPEIKKELKLDFKDKKQSSLWDLLIPKAHANELEGNLVINLPSNEKAEGYKVEIYSDSDLKNLLFSTTSKKAEFEWSKAHPGQFWYRYALIDAWGRESEMSPASMLNVIPGQISPPERARLLRPIRSQIVEGPVVTFAWTLSARTQNYVLKISKNEDFENIFFEQSLNDNQKMLEADQFEKGEKYYWKVLSRHQFGETSSNTGRFIYSKKESLLLPEKESTSKMEKILRPLKAYGLASLSWVPQSLEMKIDEREFNADISGTLMNSLQLDWRYYFKKKWALDLKVNNQSGKVFNTEDYLSRQLTLAALYSMSGESSFYHFSFGAAQNNFSSFTLTTPERLSQKPENSLGASIGVEWEKRFEKTDSLHSAVSLVAGDATDFQFRVFYRRFLRAGFFAQSGLHYQNQSVKTKTGNNESTLLGLSVGAGFSF